MGVDPTNRGPTESDPATGAHGRADRHTVAYYSPDIYGFNDDGFKGWWHAYFAYRSAPMGRVSAATVTAVFYNFAPRMVERAVPGCWDIMEPDAVRARQLELTTASMQRALGSYPDP